MEAEMDWQRLARANTHPLRISVLEILAMDGGRTLSPSDLSYELRVPLSNVNYHVTELVKSELIELERQRQVRGATEHFYRLIDHSQARPSTNGHGPDRQAAGNGNGHRPEERTTGLEPATSSLGSSRSTN
jgi:predicted ArsR family transcriptional regulator